MRPDNNGLKIAMVGWLGVALSIASIFTSWGDLQAILLKAIIPLALSLLFVFTKRATFGVLFLCLMIFDRLSTIAHGIFWKKAILIFVIVVFVYGIVLAILVKKPKD